MRRAIAWVLIAAIAVALAWWLKALTGTVAITLPGWSLQAPTAVAFIAIVVVVLLLAWVVGLIRAIFRVPRRWRHWRTGRRRGSGDEAVTRTLVAIAASDESTARRESARARALLGDTPQTLLLAAESARLAKREEDATALYQQLARHPDAALLGLRGLFRQAISREAWDEASAIARRAEEVHPGGAWLREEREELALRTGNWQQALQLADPDAPRAALATAAAEAAVDPDEGLRRARLAWRDARDFAPAALAYAKRLRETGQESKLAKVVREAWKSEPVPDLATLALAPVAEPAARLREAEKLTALNPDHPETRLLRARLALDAGLVGEARRYAEAARAAGFSQRRLWLLLADIEAASGEGSEASRVAQREALRRAATADPDSGWRCESCGTQQAAWRPDCPACRSTGRIRWSAPKPVPVAALTAS
jgi:HemY protein